MPQAGAWPGGVPLPPGLMTLNGLPPSLPMLPPQVWQNWCMAFGSVTLLDNIINSPLHTPALVHNVRLTGAQLCLQMAGLQQPPGVGLPGGLPPVPFCPRWAAASALRATRLQHACARSRHYGGSPAACMETQVHDLCLSSHAGRLQLTWRRCLACMAAPTLLPARWPRAFRCSSWGPACPPAAACRPVCSRPRSRTSTCELDPAVPSAVCCAWDHHTAFVQLTAIRRENTADWGDAVPAGWRRWQPFRPPTQWPARALSRCCMQSPVWSVFIHINVRHMHVVPRFS